MLLERRVPERVLRVLLVAGEEPGVGAPGIDGEHQGKTEPDGRTVGAASLAFEGENLEVADARSAKRCVVGLRVAALHRQHGEPLVARPKIAVEGAERER